jgi:hypothetical protein
MKTKGNPVARSPLLRKGGPHQRAVSGERDRARQALRRQVDDCLDRPLRSGRRSGSGSGSGSGSTASSQAR